MYFVAIAVMLAGSDPSSASVPAATPAAAASSAPAAPGAPAGVLREIVYKVAQTTSSNGTGSDYSGTSTASQSGWDKGTLTIDVLQILAGDIINVRASEAWNDLGGKPYSATGYVAADGTLSIVSGTYSAVMETVLPYLATGFIGSHDTTLGTSWDLTADADKVHYQHHYAITKIDGSNVTVTVNGTMSGFGMGMFPTTEQDTVVYRPARIVPISGDFTTRTRSSNGNVDTTVTHNLHFERVSDSKDPNP